MSTALKDIKVLDFTHLLPGELLAGLLFDLGADVTRIESPRRGLAHQLPPVVKGESLYYWSLHRGNKRLHVNLKDERGTELIHRLAPRFDVLIENFRPGVMDRLSIGYDHLKKINPQLVYCSISGYGRYSSSSTRAAHDLNLVAESGLLDLNRRLGERPVIPAIPVSDYMSGTLAALSVVTALYERTSSGKGRHLDITMLESSLATLNIMSSMTMYTREEPLGGGFHYPREMANYNVYECQDGRHLAVASLETPFWHEFCDRIGLPDLKERDPEEDEGGKLIEVIAARVAEKTLAEWQQTFEGANCCVSPVNTLSESLDKFPLAERGMISELTHPSLGKINQVMFPVDRQLRRDTPRVRIADGVKEVEKLLENSGYTAAEIDKLIEERVVSHQPAQLSEATP